jgi:hypothetical protein
VAPCPPVFQIPCQLHQNHRQVTVGALPCLMTTAVGIVTSNSGWLADHEGNGSTQFSDKDTGWLDNMEFYSWHVKQIFLLSKTPRPSLGPTNGYRGPTPRIRRQGHDADCSPPSKAKVQNERTCTSAPCIHHHDKQICDFASMFTDSNMCCSEMTRQFPTFQRNDYKHRQHTPD